MPSKMTPERRAHQEWIGFVQPVGLVVSFPALDKAQCYVAKNVIAEQEALRALARPVDEPVCVPELALLCRDVLGWEDGDLVPANDRFTVALPEYQDTLRADFIVADSDDADGAVALVSVLADGTDLDQPDVGHGWVATPQARFERLLRETRVSIGLLFNQRALRLVYAPSGESSGHATFVVRDMLAVAGRPILAGLHALLSAHRLFNLPAAQRLPKILEESRLYQSEVSTQLSEQVLGALHELLRGFQAAHDASDGRLLGEVLREDPSEVYGGLLTTLLRLVFILYAEDRGLLSNEQVYVRHYAVGALYEKLREDAARYPDTMDQRFGAWAQLLTLFRMIHDGVEHAPFRLPPRYGRVFDPDAYPFLEARPRGVVRQRGVRLSPPRVSDGVVYRVLEGLLVLDGERLSYRTLDVEQIGSVYEAMMGFELLVVHERSIGLKGKRKKGAPPADPIVGLETLLAKKGASRAAHLASTTGVKVTGKAAKALKEATTIDALVAALDRRISRFTPSVLSGGGMALEPTAERRRSGSHYTPRALTEPMVEKTLRPHLQGPASKRSPEAILALKVCDPAMGSGAFLVATCRALGAELLKAWQLHGMPTIPADEDPELFARRRVAQQCLYGVDKNPFAVDLAKLSLWLVTLAKEHPFTFLDHALRCGDSLVGLSRRQIAGFHWSPAEDVLGLRGEIDAELNRANALRQKIHELADSDDTEKKRRLLRDADDALARVRRVGDVVIDAFFSETKATARKARLAEIGATLRKGFDQLPSSPEAERLRAFHWEIEFPEVFSRDDGGFDAFVGNPPFSGKNGVVAIHAAYLDWLKTIHEGTHGNADLVAHFFRRTFGLVRTGGTLGLIATNTIAQGDTRSTGLRWIVAHEGVIYDATRRYKWPAGAAVIVSRVHIVKRPSAQVSPLLDGRSVGRITAFLFHTGPDEDPVTLQANAGKSFQGSIVLGMGFTFDDTNPDATPLVEMERLIAKDARNSERIFPYLGGDELNTSPTHAHHRYVINFGQMSEEEARAWPDLMAIVEEKVKPARLAQNRETRARYWWRFGEVAPGLNDAIRDLDEVIAVSRVSEYGAFAFVSARAVLSERLAVFSKSEIAFFGLLQSRVHEVYSKFMQTTHEDRSGYQPTRCFETFPLPNAGAQRDDALRQAADAYHGFRATLLVRSDKGLTPTYNRFHDPDERDPDILRLRELHAAMDRAVLDAYGWTDLQPTCAFLLDYEEEDEDDEGSSRRKKKPWRYRWPDDFRDEVLARLLTLNAERAEEQRRLGLEATLANAEPSAKKKTTKRNPSKPKKTKAEPIADLFARTDPKEE